MSRPETSEERMFRSVRVGRLHHFRVEATEDTPATVGVTEFKSINLAKRESRRLGGTGSVRAFHAFPGRTEIARLLGVA